jgi:hypothetical protein
MGDFDFFVGTWDVTNRRLRRRHVGSDDWDVFPGVSVARSFFDGAGSFDEIRFPTRDFAGSTVRLVGDHRPLVPLGAGVLHRRRAHLGDKLDHGVRACRLG